MTSAAEAAASATTVGHRSSQACQRGTTRSTCVCCSITSETRIAYGSRVRRHGRSRPCSANQLSSRSSTPAESHARAGRRVYITHEALRLRGLCELLQGAAPARAAGAAVRACAARHLRRRHAHRRLRGNQPAAFDTCARARRRAAARRVERDPLLRRARHRVSPKRHVRARRDRALADLRAARRDIDDGWTALPARDRAAQPGGHRRRTQARRCRRSARAARRAPERARLPRRRPLHDRRHRELRVQPRRGRRRDRPLAVAGGRRVAPANRGHSAVHERPRAVPSERPRRRRPFRLHVAPPSWLTAEVAATAVLQTGSATQRGRVAVAVAAVAWSLAGVLQRELSVSLATQLAGRAFFAALLLLGYAALHERGNPWPAFRTMGRAGLIVAALMAISSGAFITALNHASVANVIFMQALAPILAALLGVVVLKEAVPRITWIAMAVAIGGVALMVGGPGRPSLLGEALSFLMVVAFSLMLIVTRRERDVSMAPATCLSQLVVLVLAVPFARPGEIGGKDFVLLIALGFAQIGLGLILLTVGARLIPAAEVALISLLEVVLAPLWVWIVVSESPSTATLIGGAIVLVAVGLQGKAAPS